MQAQIVKNPGAPQGHTGTRRRFGLDFGTFARIGQTLYVELGVVGVVVACVQIFLNIAQGVANTINMKWILERAANSFFDDIFKDAQYLCACLKVPLLSPYSLIYVAMRLFFADLGH